MPQSPVDSHAMGVIGEGAVDGGREGKVDLVHGGLVEGGCAD